MCYDNRYVFLFLILLIFSCQKKKSETFNTEKISLAEWSLHKALYRREIDHLDFPRIAANQFEIYAVEYVSQFFQDKASDFEYLGQLKDSCDRYGVKSLMIMIDNEGCLGDTSEVSRKQSVSNHLKWIQAASFLGCESIRVNGVGLGPDAEVGKALAKSLKELAIVAGSEKVYVLVENHGMIMPDGHWSMKSFSTNGENLSNVLNEVNHENVRALPDFGNFDDYDRYQGVMDLLPFAQGISAKSYGFDKFGDELHTDYAKMFRLINESDFDGYIGIEYESSNDDSLSEYQGIQKTKDLILRYWKTP